MNEQIHFVIFRLDERTYGLRLSQTQQVVRAAEFTPIPQVPDVVLGVIDLHGEIVPVFNIRKRFGLVEQPIGADDHFIIARTSKCTVALAVNSVTGITEQPMEAMIATETMLSRSEQIEGVIRCQDGLALIHDLDRFLSLEEEQILQQALTEQPEHGS